MGEAIEQRACSLSRPDPRGGAGPARCGAQTNRGRPWPFEPWWSPGGSEPGPVTPNVDASVALKWVLTEDGTSQPWRSCAWRWRPRSTVQRFLDPPTPRLQNPGSDPGGPEGICTRSRHGCEDGGV